MHILLREFPHALKKPWITTAILRSMRNKDKLHKKYLNQKRFLIDTVLHDTIKRNRNMIEKLLRTPYFSHYIIQGQNDMNERGKKYTNNKY